MDQINLGELRVMFGVNDRVKQILQLAGVTAERGDTRVNWDPNKPKEVEVARTVFHKLLGEGYHAFEVKGADKQGDEIEEFDPAAAKIILVAPVAGG